MLPLLERVVGHLERVRRVAEKDVVDRAVALDYDRFEAFVLELYDRADPNGAEALEQRGRWAPAYLRAFVEELHWALLDRVGARWPSNERFKIVEDALTSASGFEVEASGLPPSRTQMLDELVDTTEENVGHSERQLQGLAWKDEPRGGALWNFAVSYCDRLGLSGASADRWVASPLGATLVRLRGIDRLRWLLAIETLLATSNRDPWCVDLGSVRHLAGEDQWHYAYPEDAPIPDATVRRWTELGALRHWEDEEFGVHGYRLTTIGREIFGELARNESTSFRILARSLLEDDRERVLASEVGVEPMHDRATAATLRHARMVAHEVRNTLLPIQYALKKVWASPAMAAADLSEQRLRIDEGFARLHRFIDDSLRLTPIAAEEAAVFSVMEAIDEARRQCIPGPEGGIQIETLPASANPKCRGHRGRLVLALLNLLRNAVQVGGPGVRVRISVDARAPHSVVIRVHDDGPGIPEAQRDTLFENGVSHRDGGSGHGLSFVRTVIEQEMRGRVRLVSPSEAAGACFELELTTEEDTK